MYKSIIFNSLAHSICIHYSCFENMGWFVTLKKGPKYVTGNLHGIYSGVLTKLRNCELTDSNSSETEIFVATSPLDPTKVSSAKYMTYIVRIFRRHRMKCHDQIKPSLSAH